MITSTDIHELCSQLNNGVISETEFLLAMQVTPEMQTRLQHMQHALRPEVLMKLTIDDYAIAAAVADKCTGQPLKKSIPALLDGQRKRYFEKLHLKLWNDSPGLCTLEELARAVKFSLVETDEASDEVEYMVAIDGYDIASAFSSKVLGVRSLLKKNLDGKHVFTVDHEVLRKARLIPPTQLIEV